MDAQKSFPSTYGPLYYASAVLADGRVIVIGGEYNNGTPSCTSNPGCDVNIGYILDPSTANPWTALTVPAWGSKTGDAVGVVLPDGTFVIGHLNDTQMAKFNPATNDFTLLSPTGKADNNSEEGWTLLPDGTLLDVDAGTQGGTGSEIYTSSTNSWASAGSTIVSLPDNSGTGCNCVPELGPAILKPDGKVLATGATLHNALYDTATGKWSAANDFPTVGSDQMVAADAPASLLRGGHVLVSTSKFFAGPTHLFEFDGTNWNAVPDPSNNGNASYQTRMLLLPNGQVLFTDNSNDLEIYTPTGAADAYRRGWAPTITSAPSNVTPGTTYTISGTQFNGLSQANAYGDDTQNATNYPLVRITNHATGHVFYARTHDHSTMGVATGGTIVSTQFDAPASSGVGRERSRRRGKRHPLYPIVINGPDLTITKSHTDPFTQGDTGDTFTITVKNVGKATRAGPSPSSIRCRRRSRRPPSAAAAGPATRERSPARAATCWRPERATRHHPDGGRGGQRPDLRHQHRQGVRRRRGRPTSPGTTPPTIRVTVRQHTVTTVQPATEDFDDVVTLTATVTPSGVSGSVQFFVNGANVGAAGYNSGTGVATSRTSSRLPAGYATAWRPTSRAQSDLPQQLRALPKGLTVTLEETTLSYTGDTVIANGGTATMSGTLLEDGIKPIAGRTVTFTLGTGVSAQTCNAVTNVSGVATCAISPVAQPLGPGIVADAFAGDASICPASASANTICSRSSRAAPTSSAIKRPDRAGATFWGAQWSARTSSAAGPLRCFKGFASLSRRAAELPR